MFLYSIIYFCVKVIKIETGKRARQCLSNGHTDRFLVNLSGDIGHQYETMIYH
jgi:hypothetical protein